MTTISSNMASSWATKLFSQLDTKNQGYIEQSDLETAFSKISEDSTDVEDIFSQMDSDSDGKVTKDELTTALQQVADELDSQYNNMRMQGGPEGMGGPGGPGGAGGMPPPPPPENDAGFTEEELTAQLEEIGDTDSQRSELISSVLEDFDTADADGDGRVTFKEAMALNQSSESDSSSTDTSSITASSSDTSSTSTASTQNDAVMMKIMQLMQAYQVFGRENDESNFASLFSASA